VARQGEPVLLQAAEEMLDLAPGHGFPDRRLELLFACTHPAIDPGARTPLIEAFLDRHAKTFRLDGSMNLSVRVIDLSPIADRRAIWATLDSRDWNFTLGLLVTLRGGGVELHARQSGTANVGGRPVVQLTPLTEWQDALTSTEALRRGSIEMIVCTG
jgi:hypothetical protein